MIRLLRPAKYCTVLGSLVKNRLRGKSVYPFYASFKLTSRCHFNCSFCNIRDDSRDDLPADRIRAVLDNLVASCFYVEDTMAERGRKVT